MVLETHTLVEVVAGAQNALAAAQQATHLVGQLRTLSLLQLACTTNQQAL